MPIIKLGKVDVFAMLDSDTDEARTFTTYLGYWDCLARTITDTYGSDFAPGVIAELESRKAYRALTSTQFKGDDKELRALLLNAWNSELALYLVDDDDARLMTQNQWNNVYAYYASGRVALAWLLVRDGAAPHSHRKLLEAVAAQAVASKLYPAPWSLACTGYKAAVTYAGFTTPPPDVHNLETGADCFGGTAKLLKTTRRKRLEALKNKRIGENGWRRAPGGFEATLDAAAAPTTVFDFMWRSRTRANYGDPSMFYMGTLSEDRSLEYVSAVRTVTSATMLLFEAFVGQKAKATLIDAATHYISRDRTKITDVVLGARLRALGLI